MDSTGEPSGCGKDGGAVQEAVEYLLDYPGIGRAGRLSDTKELVVTGTPFIVIYRLRSPTVQILRLLHHARKWG